MTVMRVNDGSRRWVGALALMLASAAGTGLWWMNQPLSSGDPSEPVGAPMAVLEVPGDRAGGESALTPQEAVRIVDEQARVAKVIEQQPRVPAEQGFVRSRPDYVSLMEWTAIQALAQRSARPDEEVTRLVNELRFFKQLEAWRSASGDETAARRQQLALALLEEMPMRLERGDLPVSEIRGLVVGLLKDAYPDARERSVQTAVMEKQLKDAEAKLIQ